VVLPATIRGGSAWRACSDASGNPASLPFLPPEYVMPAFRSGLLLFVVAVAAAPSAADDLLQWKLSSGDSLNYQVLSRTVTQSNVGGFESETLLVHSMQMTWDVETVTANNSFVVGQVIRRIRVELSPNGNETFIFDSGENSVPDNNIVRSLGNVFRRLVDQRFLVTMTSTGAFTDVLIPNGLAQTLKEAAAGNPSAIDEKTLRQMMSQASVILPESPVAPGHQWQSEQTIDLGFATLQMTPQMTYRGVNDDGYAVIDYVPHVNLTADEEAAVQMRLRDATGAGTVLFDLQRGRVVRMELQLTMEMVTELNGRQTTQKIQQTTQMQLTE